MTTYVVRHTTRYDYDVPVVHAHHMARLRPRQLSFQRVSRSGIKVDPEPHSTVESIDYFGNHADTIEMLEPHDSLVVTSHSTISTLPNSMSLSPPFGALTWERAALELENPATFLKESELSFDSPLVRAHSVFVEYARSVFTPGRDLVESTIELNRRINTDFAYEPAATDVSTPLGQVMRERRGVCQDFAHVAIACLRSVGLAARYVSGYLETIPPEGKERLVGADASHAWASVFVPGHGWLDFDPTNNVLPSERHIWVGWGRDFSDVSPLKGVVLGGGAQRLTVGVDVEPQRAKDAAPNKDTIPPKPSIASVIPPAPESEAGN